MYAPAQSLTMADQIASGSDCGDGGEPLDNRLARFGAHSLEDGAGVGGLIEDLNPDSVYAPAGDGSDIAMQRSDGSSQLTLSFRGQVYLFDTVSPEKVQAVLLFSTATLMDFGVLPHEVIIRSINSINESQTNAILAAGEAKAAFSTALGHILLAQNDVERQAAAEFLAYAHFMNHQARDFFDEAVATTTQYVDIINMVMNNVMG